MIEIAKARKYESAKGFHPQMSQMDADEEESAFICVHLRHLRIDLSGVSSRFRSFRAFAISINLSRGAARS